MMGHRAHTNLSDPSAYEELVSSISKVAVSSSHPSTDPAAEDVSGGAPAARIKDFWLTALRNHRALRLLINERDAQALTHLIDVRLSYLTGSGGFTSPSAAPSSPSISTGTSDAGSDEKEGGEREKKDKGPLGYKLTFVFEPNEFFSNATLSKTYVYRRELDWTGNTVVDYAEGTPIRWKSEGVNLTKNGTVLGASISLSSLPSYSADHCMVDFQRFDVDRSSLELANGETPVGRDVVLQVLQVL